MTLTDSRLDPKRASYDVTLESGLGWTHVLSPGQIFRIVDLEGNQAVDTLFYNADDETERYSAVDTVREQGNLYLSVGTRLLSSEGRALCTYGVARDGKLGPVRMIRACTRPLSAAACGQ